MKGRVVIKIGSSVLAAGGDRVQPSVIGRLAKEAALARADGREVVLVSSGAILSGWPALGLPRRPTATQTKQACAAVGQSRLMRAWESALARRGLKAAQVLLTREDVHHRRRYLNARNTLLELLRLGAVPVVNENDTVADEEIRFGDNDVLSALVAALCDAELLVLLTDQKGLYTADPRRDPSARLVSRVAPGAAVAAGAAGPHGSGGMESKVRAARMAAAAGVPAVIASGLEPGALAAVLRGESEGTLFEPRGRRLEHRRRWLAFAAKPRGRVEVDEGARRAVEAGRSLLPSGIKRVSGDFGPGDAVRLVAGGREFARGLSNYAAADLERIKGLKTAEIEGALGHRPADEAVHRDNLALFEELEP